MFTFPESPMNSLDTAISIFVLTSTCVMLVAERIPRLNRETGVMVYSKFAHQTKYTTLVSSQTGLLLSYTPALILALLRLLQPILVYNNNSSSNAPTTTTMMMPALLAVHFGKRVFECIFVHKYSGSMPWTTPPTIASLYVLGALIQLHAAASRVKQDGQPSGTQTILGLLFYVGGLVGNGYHHWLLAQLRKGSSSSKAYLVPSGGLFEYVAAPHYLSEIIEWLGVAMVAGHIFSLALCAPMIVYLGHRADGQREWNRQKFKEDFPAERMRLVPFLY